MTISKIDQSTDVLSLALSFLPLKDALQANRVNWCWRIFALEHDSELSLTFENRVMGKENGFCKKTADIFCQKKISIMRLPRIDLTGYFEVEPSSGYVTLKEIPPTALSQTLMVYQDPNGQYGLAARVAVSDGEKRVICETNPFDISAGSNHNVDIIPTLVARTTTTEAAYPVAVEGGKTAILDGDIAQIKIVSNSQEILAAKQEDNSCRRAGFPGEMVVAFRNKKLSLWRVPELDVQEKSIQMKAMTSPVMRFQTEKEHVGLAYQIKTENADTIASVFYDSSSKDWVIQFSNPEMQIIVGMSNVIEWVTQILNGQHSTMKLVGEQIIQTTNPAPYIQRPNDPYYSCKRTSSKPIPPRLSPCQKLCALINCLLARVASFFACLLHLFYRLNT